MNVPRARRCDRGQAKTIKSYGEKSMARAQPAQGGYGEKIRRDPRRTEGQARLRRFGEAAARCQPGAIGESLLDEWSPSRLSAQICRLPPDVPRGRVERVDSR